MDTDLKPKIMVQRKHQPETIANTEGRPNKVTFGFWAFLRTLFIGSAGLAVLAVAGTLGGSVWLTANQRAEADKAQPWADPSFTTTAVTTGGLLARWMDADGNLENGHTYVKGIYEVWKSKQGQTWESIANDTAAQAKLPQLWQLEFNADAEKRKQAIAIERETTLARRRNEAAKEHLKNFHLDR